MNLRPEILDELLKEYKNPEDLLGEGGILKQLTKALIERCLNGELETHLQEERESSGEEPNQEKQKNRRNGRSKKTLKGDFGEMEIAVPRDRNSSFEPIMVPLMSKSI